MALARFLPRTLRLTLIALSVWAGLLGAGRLLRPDPTDCCGPLGTARPQPKTTAELFIPGKGWQLARTWSEPDGLERAAAHAREGMTANGTDGPSASLDSLSAAGAYAGRIFYCVIR